MKFAQRKNKFIYIAAIRDIDIIYQEFLDYDESVLKENIVLYATVKLDLDNKCLMYEIKLQQHLGLSKNVV